MNRCSSEDLIVQVSSRSSDWLDRTLAAVRDAGCAVVKDVLSERQLEVTRAAMYRVRDAIFSSVGADRLRRSGELGVLRLMMQFDTHFFSLLELTPMLAVVDGTVSPTATLHLQNGLLLPSAERDPDRAAARSAPPFHRDFPRVLNRYLMSINCMLALDEFTNANGATRVVLTSHQQTDPPDLSDLERRAVSIECPVRSMIVFDSTLWHAAGINRSGADRLAINHQFTRAYLKPQIDYVRALGDKTVLGLPEKTQQLLGWYTRVPASLEDYYRPESERLYRRGQG